MPQQVGGRIVASSLLYPLAHGPLDPLWVHRLSIAALAFVLLKCWRFTVVAFVRALQPFVVITVTIHSQYASTARIPLGPPYYILNTRLYICLYIKYSYSARSISVPNSASVFTNKRERLSGACGTDQCQRYRKSLYGSIFSWFQLLCLCVCVCVRGNRQTLRSKLLHVA